MYLKFNSLRIINEKITLSVESDVQTIRLYIDGLFIKNMTKNNTVFTTELDIFESGSIALKNENEEVLLNLLFANMTSHVDYLQYEECIPEIDVPYTTPKLSSIILSSVIVSVDAEQNYNQGFWDGYVLGYNVK